MPNLDKDFYLDKQGLRQLVNEFETNVIAEEYSSSATYAVGAYCTHDNKMYRCTTAITTAENWNSAHWSLILIGDELKSKKSGTVTSVTIKGTSPIVSSSESAITTSGTRTISHADSGVTAGTYKSVTVNATGHVTEGTNPTTLSGYGITDAKIESRTITLGSNSIQIPTITDTYSGTSSDGMSGKAVKSAIDALDGGTIGTPGASKTLTALSQTNGNISATFGDIAIANTQVSGLGTASTKDVPASGNASTTQVVLGSDTRLSNARTPTSHTHGNIQNGGTLQTNDITIASGDKLVVTDSSDSAKVARTSISFDGSTTTKALTPKGTWETFGTSNLTLGTTSTTALKGDTKYAGSSTAGGSATSAAKLDTSTAGSATQPCYFANGVPSACTYSLNKTVPSNAVFTDTNTIAGMTDVQLTSPTDNDLLVYDSNLSGGKTWKNAKKIVTCTKAQFDAWSANNSFPYTDCKYIVTDVNNLNTTSADIPYDSTGTDSVYDVVEDVKSDVAVLSIPQTIAPTFNTQQSDYSIPYNNTSIVKLGKVVMCMVNPRCLNSIGSYPGTLVYSGFPKPVDGLNHYFTVANWQRSGDTPIRFMLTSSGELYLRNGTVDSEYDGSFVYISE